jgi:hypothetical protein
VPFLFFSTGQHPDYHKPTDLPDRIDYAKLRRACLLINELTGRLANDDEAPAWDENGLPPDLDEVRVVHELVKRVLAKPEQYPLSKGQHDLVAGVDDRLGGILKRGQVTGDERNWLIWTARLLLTTVF